METAKIKPSGIKSKRPEDTAQQSGFTYYLAHTLLFLLKIAVFLMFFFSLQNVSDSIRSVPFLNQLAPFPALLFSYLCVHVFCMYFFIVWFGSFRKFYRKLGATLIEIRGLLIYAIVVPLGFTLVAGGLWWCATRIKIVSFLVIPFLFIPDTLQRLYDQGLPFVLFSVMTAVFLLALLFLVVFLQRMAERKPQPVQEAVAEKPQPLTPEIMEAPEKQIVAKPIQPVGQPPLHMKK